MIKEIENFLSFYKPNPEKKTGNYNTHRRYYSDLKKFSEYFNIQDVHDIEKITPDEWRNFISSIDNKPKSINALIRSVHSFIGHLKDDEILMNEKITTTKLVGDGGKRSTYVKEEDKIHVLITDKEFMLMFNASDLQDKILLGILRYCGLRESEAAGIKIKDIDFENSSFIVVKGKGSKPRQLGIPPTLLSLIEEYIKTRKQKSDYLFIGKKGPGSGEPIIGQTVNGRIKGIMRDAGFSDEKISQITAHKFRGVFATENIKNFGLEATRQMLGHTSIATTQIYNAGGFARDFMKTQKTAFDGGEDAHQDN